MNGSTDRNTTVRPDSEPDERHCHKGRQRLRCRCDGQRAKDRIRSSPVKRSFQYVARYGTYREEASGRWRAIGKWEKESMKPSSTVILLTLVATTVSLAFATPEHKISLAEPTVLANLWLRPGKYTIEWNSTGGNKVDVSFVQGTRTVATVTGTIKAAQNGRDVAAVLGGIDASGARRLFAIEMRDSTLLFQVIDATTGETLQLSRSSSE